MNPAKKPSLLDGFIVYYEFSVLKLKRSASRYKKVVKKYDQGDYEQDVDELTTDLADKP